RVRGGEVGEVLVALAKMLPSRQRCVLRAADEIEIDDSFGIVAANRHGGRQTESGLCCNWQARLTDRLASHNRVLPSRLRAIWAARPESSKGVELYDKFTTPFGGPQGAPPGSVRLLLAGPVSLE